MSTDNPIVSNHYKFYLSKSSDIFYISLLYVSISYFPAVYHDRLFGTIFGKDFEKKTLHELLFEVILQISFSGVIAYILRNIIVRIPSPFHGVADLDHYRVKELNSGAVMFTFLLAFQSNLQKKIGRIRELSSD